MGLSKLEFILFYSTFLFFIMQLSAMAGYTVISNAPPTPELSGTPSVLDSLIWVFANLGYFFALMTVSTEFFLFGVMILTPFVVGVVWMLLELARGI